MKKTQINDLIQIKNAAMLNKDHIFINKSEKTLKILEVLYTSGYIQTYKCLETKIEVVLRYYNNQSSLKKIVFISKPSYKKFLSYKEIVNFSNSNRTLIFSTDLGLLSQKDCIRKSKGGKLLFIV
jgi:ribosomal protein S8